ncbi:MAG: hypothetical protein WCY58_11880 [Mariniphaga sp.]|nr:hypothetical protein [Mariniphaga sp.]MDD4225357.1 hypothetical protein [Mariniphaga sp.]MDD4424389.1 hypothetical protein [Mariniphaga sp.]
MRDNLSQRKLLDILTSEIEQLNKTTENIKAVAPEIDKQLKELKKEKLQVDLNTGRLEQILKDHEDALQKKVVIPKWFLVLIGVVIAFLMLEVVWLLVV